MDRNEIINSIESERSFLEDKLKYLINHIGNIPIANKKIMPYGWRKAAKGRTVWRIIEEIISQNLEMLSSDLGFKSVTHADSEVGVYDFKFSYSDSKEAFVNIKSAVKGGKRNKDDISKAKSLLEFYSNPKCGNLYVATFVIAFNDDMTISITKCIVCPVSWIPDVYVNPSNNGNLQSADYKDLSLAVKRTNAEFLEVFTKEYNVALEKKAKKINS